MSDYPPAWRHHELSAYRLIGPIIGKISRHAAAGGGLVDKRSRCSKALKAERETPEGPECNQQIKADPRQTNHLPHADEF